MDWRALHFTRKEKRMSKIALPLAELKPALIGLGKVIEKRSSLPVLTNIKVERTKDGWIALTGTDLTSFVTVRLEQPTEGEPCSVLIPYEDLLKVSKSCGKNDTISMLTGENVSELSVILQYPVGNGVMDMKVDSLPLVEFPTVPKVAGEAVPLPNPVHTAIHEALECASTEET